MHTYSYVGRNPSRLGHLDLALSPKQGSLDEKYGTEPSIRASVPCFSNKGQLTHPMKTVQFRSRLKQGILTEGESSIRLTSLSLLVYISYF
jgi:hypothetical protein